MHRDTIFQYETMVPDTIKTHSQTSLGITAVSYTHLSLGADDYISKPFGVMELRARINAHLRREHREHSVRMVLGRVCIQMSQKKLLVDDKMCIRDRSRGY